MKHPALTRMLGVFLAVVSLLTAVAGATGFGKLDKDRQEQLRQAELLESRARTAQDLERQMETLQDEYDAAMSVYPDRQAQHSSRRSDYRTELATYTATRAGLVLGREQLDQTSEMLKQSMELFQIGLSMFLQGEKAFQSVYDIYLTVRQSLDEGEEIYRQAASRTPEGEENAPVSFRPEEVLALAELEHRTNGELSRLLQNLQDETPADQHQAADYLRRAIDGYNEIAPQLQGLDIPQLAYQASLNLYDRAAEAMNASLGEGGDAEAARAAADRICQESFGMSFDELGEWLAQNEPAPSGDPTESVDSLPPEMLDELLSSLPGDRDLIGAALGLLADSDAALTEKEEAFREDPHDMSAAELLLAASKEGLDSSERLLGLVEPTILETKQQMDSTHEQLDAAWFSIYSGQQAVKDGYQQLDDTAAELDGQLEDMKGERAELETEKLVLDKLEESVSAYETVRDRFRSARSALLSDDELYELADQGAEPISAAKNLAAQRKEAAQREAEIRTAMCCVMLAAALFGLISSLGAFEKPRIRRLWIPVFAAVLTAAAGEAISLVLGRGLWYTALFIVIFGLGMFPLILGNGKGEAI